MGDIVGRDGDHVRTHGTVGEPQGVKVIGICGLVYHVDGPPDCWNGESGRRMPDRGNIAWRGDRHTWIDGIGVPITRM